MSFIARLFIWKSRIPTWQREEARVRYQALVTEMTVSSKKAMRRSQGSTAMLLL